MVNSHYMEIKLHRVIDRIRTKGKPIFYHWDGRKRPSEGFAWVGVIICKGDPKKVLLFTTCEMVVNRITQFQTYKNNPYWTGDNGIFDLGFLWEGPWEKMGTAKAECHNWLRANGYHIVNKELMPRFKSKREAFISMDSAIKYLGSAVDNMLVRIDELEKRLDKISPKEEKKNVVVIPGYAPETPNVPPPSVPGLATTAPESGTVPMAPVENGRVQ